MLPGAMTAESSLLRVPHARQCQVADLCVGVDEQGTRCVCYKDTTEDAYDDDAHPVGRSVNIE
jgi:hypothetical protein